VEEVLIDVMLEERSVGRFCGRRCWFMGRRFSTATTTRGGLRSAPNDGQRFKEEAQVQAVFEEVALAQPHRRWLAQKRAALQRGGTSEQGAALHGNCEQGARERRVVHASQAEQHKDKVQLT
jgi:hypothetical protein